MDFARVLTSWRRVRRSIITRMLLVALVVVGIGFAARLIALRTILTEDVAALSASHQLSIAEYAARDVEDKVRLRLNLLTALAPGLNEQLQVAADELPAWLRQRRVVLWFFSEGLTLLTPEGHLLASTRDTPLRWSPDWFAASAVDSGGTVSKPYRLEGKGIPVLDFAVPVRDAAGGTVAILVGTVAIDADNFLHSLSSEKVGETGDFLLVDPRNGVFVTAGTPERVLKPVPLPGINPLHDKAMAGYRGAGITTNIHGVEELSAIASVPTPGWFLVARTPTAEAMRPVAHISRLVVIGSVVIPVVTLTMLLVVMIRLLRPLRDAAIQLHQMARGMADIRPLPVVRDDEVGDLAKGFNFLLDTQEQLRHLAHHDLLTGLPNRAMFEDRLDQALLRSQRHAGSFALLYLDLDGFKPINDSLGHAAGDTMLRHVALQLTAILRQSDTVARIGGDEFAVLLGDLDDPAAAETVAEQCRRALDQPLDIAGTPCRVGVSIGIACHPRDGMTAGELLRHADQAMYQAKQRNKAMDAAQ